MERGQGVAPQLRGRSTADSLPPVREGYVREFLATEGGAPRPVDAPFEVAELVGWLADKKNMEPHQIAVEIGKDHPGLPPTEALRVATAFANFHPRQDTERAMLRVADELYANRDPQRPSIQSLTGQATSEEERTRQMMGAFVKSLHRNYASNVGEFQGLQEVMQEMLPVVEHMVDIQAQMRGLPQAAKSSSDFAKKLQRLNLSADEMQARLRAFGSKLEDMPQLAALPGDMHSQVRALAEMAETMPRMDDVPTSRTAMRKYAEEASRFADSIDAGVERRPDDMSLSEVLAMCKEFVKVELPSLDKLNLRDLGEPVFVQSRLQGVIRLQGDYVGEKTLVSEATPELAAKVAWLAGEKQWPPQKIAEHLLKNNPDEVASPEEARAMVKLFSDYKSPDQLRDGMTGLRNIEKFMGESLGADTARKLVGELEKHVDWQTGELGWPQGKVDELKRSWQSSAPVYEEYLTESKRLAEDVELKAQTLGVDVYPTSDLTQTIIDMQRAQSIHTSELVSRTLEFEGGLALTAEAPYWAATFVSDLAGRGKEPSEIEERLREELPGKSPGELKQIARAFVGFDWRELFAPDPEDRSDSESEPEEEPKVVLGHLVYGERLDEKGKLIDDGKQARAYAPIGVAIRVGELARGGKPMDEVMNHLRVDFPRMPLDQLMAAANVFSTISPKRIASLPAVTSLDKSVVPKGETAESLHELWHASCATQAELSDPNLKERETAELQHMANVHCSPEELTSAILRMRPAMKPEFARAIASEFKPNQQLLLGGLEEDVIADENFDPKKFSLKKMGFTSEILIKLEMAAATGRKEKLSGLINSEPYRAMGNDFKYEPGQKEWLHDYMVRVNQRFDPQAHSLEELGISAKIQGKLERVARRSVDDRSELEESVEAFVDDDVLDLDDAKQNWVVQHFWRDAVNKRTLEEMDVPAQLRPKLDLAVASEDKELLSGLIGKGMPELGQEDRIWLTNYLWDNAPKFDPKKHTLDELGVPPESRDKLEQAASTAAAKGDRKRLEGRVATVLADTKIGKTEQAWIVEHFWRAAIAFVPRQYKWDDVDLDPKERMRFDKAALTLSKKGLRNTIEKSASENKRDWTPELKAWLTETVWREAAAFDPEKYSMEEANVVRKATTRKEKDLDLQPELADAAASAAAVGDRRQFEEAVGQIVNARYGARTWIAEKFWREAITFNMNEYKPEALGIDPKMMGRLARRAAASESTAELRGHVEDLLPGLKPEQTAWVAGRFWRKKHEDAAKAPSPQASAS